MDLSKYCCKVCDQDNVIHGYNCLRTHMRYEHGIRRVDDSHFEQLTEGAHRHRPQTPSQQSMADVGDFVAAITRSVATSVSIGIEQGVRSILRGLADDSLPASQICMQSIDRVFRSFDQRNIAINITNAAPIVPIPTRSQSGGRRARSAVRTMPRYTSVGATDVRLRDMQQNVAGGSSAQSAVNNSPADSGSNTSVGVRASALKNVLPAISQVPVLEQPVAGTKNVVGMQNTPQIGPEISEIPDLVPLNVPIGSRSVTNREEEDAIVEEPQLDSGPATGSDNELHLEKPIEVLSFDNAMVGPVAEDATSGGLVDHNKSNVSSAAIADDVSDAVKIAEESNAKDLTDGSSVDPVAIAGSNADDAAHDNTQELHLFVAEMVRAEVSTPKPCEEKHTEGVPESETIDSSTDLTDGSSVDPVAIAGSNADDAAHDNTQELHLFVAEMVRAEVSTPKPCNEKHTEGVPESETIDSSTEVGIGPNSVASTGSDISVGVEAAYGTINATVSVEGQKDEHGQGASDENVLVSVNTLAATKDASIQQPKEVSIDTIVISDDSGTSFVTPKPVKRAGAANQPKRKFRKSPGKKRNFRH